MQLQDKTALVTGSAKRVGRAIVEALASAGADVAIHFGRSADAAAETAEHIRRTTGRRAEVFQADLTQPDEIERLFGEVGEAFDRLDVLVNSAGVYHRTPIDNLTADEWDAEMAVNARAPALCIRCALPLMADGGAIVNIADVGAEKGWGGYPAYCASKAAVIALTKSAAKALAGRGIRVNSVSPGVALWADEQRDEDHDAVLAQVPLGRVGSAADIAAAVMFLIGNDYVTAQNLRVDGGWHTS